MISLALSLALAATPAAKPAIPEPVEALPFINDDYPRALAEAKAKKLPLFVDVWAPWCHSCISMRAYVFSDRALAKQAGRFVWLSVDTEKEQNAAFSAKYPIDAWPTLMVIEPQSGAVALKWLGSASVADLGGLLDDGARAMDPAHADQAAQTLAKADAAEGKGDHATSAKLYRDALTQGGANWSNTPRVLESLQFAMQLGGDNDGCQHLARERAPTMTHDSAYANLVATGLGCANDLPPGASRTDALAALTPLAEGALQIPGLIGDDRSGIYETLVDVHDKAGDAAGKKKLALAWLAFLEGEAAKAKSPTDRAVYDPHRVNAALEAGDPARALPAMKQTEADLPGDYNAFAREALLELELGKLDDALAANDHALKLVYGPRTLRVLDTRAEIFRKQKRDADVRATLQKAIDFASKLPTGQKNPKTIERFQKQLAELDAPKK